jgi:plastocyanin
VKRIAVLLVTGVMVTGILAQGALAAPSAPKAKNMIVKVTAVDFKFRLSKLTVPRGTTVTFKISNKGRSPHDFDLPTLRKGSPYITPGKSTSYKVTFTKSGSYRFVCTVPRHAELGMTGTFKVK